MSFLLNPYIFAVATPSYDADVQAWSDACSGTKPSASLMSNLSTFVTSLKSNSIWTKLDRIWLYASETEEQALKCIRTRTNSTKIGSPSFTISVGYGGFTTSGVVALDPSYNPTTTATAYTQNSASLGIYSRDNNTSAGTFLGNIGHRDSGTSGGMRANLNPRTSTNNIRMNANNQGLIAVSNSNSIGLFTVSRTASNDLRAFSGGSQVGATSTQASVALYNAPIYVGGIYATDSGGALGGGRELSFAFIGGGLSTTEVSNLSSAFYTLRGAIGF